MYIIHLKKNDFSNCVINNIQIMKAVEADIEMEYECIEKLGSGAFGHLILVRSKLKNEEYACKIEKNHGKVLT